MLLSKIVKKVPIISDYYNYYWLFPRHTTACRGVYNSFSDALQAIPTGSRSGYNPPETNNDSVAQLTAGRQLGEFEPSDYPVLVWLASAFADNSTIFDLGGNVGLGYYSYQKYLNYPKDLRWVVCDIPEVVNAGEELAKTTDSQGLSFTAEFADAEGADILLTCGTLQYLEDSLAKSLGKLKTKPRHLVINHVPFYDGESFTTLQNIGYSFCPYKIQNRAEFLAELSSLGYELIDSWSASRTCKIPFHPERLVSAYHGFYLRLTEQQKQGNEQVLSGSISLSKTSS